MYIVILSLWNGQIPTLPWVIYPLHQLWDQLPNSICSPSLYSLTSCVTGFSHLNASKDQLFQHRCSMDCTVKSPRLPLALTQTLSAYLSDIMKHTASAINQPAISSVFDGDKDERRKPRTMGLSVSASLHFTLQREGATLSVSGDLLLQL